MLAGSRAGASAAERRRRLRPRPGRLARGLLASTAVRWCWLLLLVGCAPSLGEPVVVVPDPEAYEAEPGFRRAVLERDLWARDNRYADARFDRYGLGESGWDALPVRDPATRPLTEADRQALQAGEDLELGDAAPFAPEPWPETEADWIALGQRVFFEYPLRADSLYTALLAEDVDLAAYGFLREGEQWVGLAVFDDGGDVAAGPTCAQCHASRDEDGVITGQLANRAMDVGAIRLRVMGLDAGDLPPELESSATGDLARLGPGRADVQGDGVFNPYAIPDFGGLAGLPYLQHNANWHHTDEATLAVRCETLFITSNAERTRIPRVLTWALSLWIRSLEPPAPSAEPDGGSEAGAVVFDETCARCHAPPLYTSDRRVAADVVGTDPAATDSFIRGTGLYRIPSLRGVSRTAPYLHDGSVPDLESMLDPGRKGGGHAFGHELAADDRAALLAFLRTI
jgi:mono/diheme cytochrome c family protein